MRFLLPTIILIAFIFSGCSEKDELNEQQIKQVQTEEKKDNNKILLTEISGKQITLNVTDKGFVFEEFKDKVVLLNFFTTWCPPCKAEIPHLNSLQNRYKNQLQIISILLEEKKENQEIISFMNTNNIEYTITNSPENFKLASHIGGVKSIPYMIIYDKNGTYFKHYIGAIPEEMIEADLKKVM